MACESGNLSQTLLDIVSKASNELLPQVGLSRNRFEDEYNSGCQLCTNENLTMSQVSDDILLVYMSEISKQFKPSTLRSKFSIIGMSTSKRKH